MIRSCLMFAVALLAVLGGVASTEASLTGKTVRVELLFPDTSTAPFTADVVVGPGAEVTNPGGRSETIDISDASIAFTNNQITANNPATFNGFSFFDILGTISPILNVTIDPVTNLAGFTAADLTFDADHIFVNFQDTPVALDTVVRLNITFGSAVPEPATGALALLGVAGLALRRRRAC